MRLVVRLLLISCLGVALARAALYLGAGWLMAGHPLEVYHLEAKMVHLAWRVQAGLPLYPDWTAHPHESNFYGPLYFLVVGAIGRGLGTDLDGLFRVGRLTTIAAGLLAAAVVGVASWRKEGKGAGLFASLLAIGSAPMVGFGTMARPDVAADLLGFAGFMLAAVGVGSSARRTILGGALLAAAILTKQTAGLYLIAAVFALVLIGRPRRAAGLAAGTGAAVLAVVLAASATVEPHLMRSLLGDSATPVALEKWRETLHRLATLSPEIPLLMIVGVVLWSIRQRRDVPLLVLAAVLGLGSTLTAMKLGSDLNYFLGLRLVAALAGGTLWGLAAGKVPARSPGGGLPPEGGSQPSRDPEAVGSLPARLAIAAALLGLLVALMPSLERSRGQWAGARLMTSPGRPALAVQEAMRVYGRFFELAEDPQTALLTDNGLIALHQGDRAAFVDPFLFRVMVEGGRIDPVAIRDRIASREYALIVTTKDLHDRDDPYDTYTFGLPPALAEAARRHYAFAGAAAGLFVYVPAGDAPGSHPEQESEPTRSRPDP